MVGSAGEQEASVGFLRWCVLVGLVACAAPKAPPSPSDEGNEGTDAGDGRPELGFFGEDTVEIERYPRMVMPPQAVLNRKMTVFVGLGETAGASAQAEVLDGPAGDRGQITLTLPELPDDAKTWTLDVILTAPDFTLDGDDFRTIQLPPDGPSTMARYDLTLTSVPDDGDTAIGAYLFHEGAYIGHIGRTIDAVARARVLGEEPEATTAVTGRGAAVRPTADSHEIHLLAIDANRALVVINQPGKTLAHTLVDFDRNALPAFLGPKFAALRSRGLDRAPTDPVGMDMVRGLGSQLWTITPAPVRSHLLKIWSDDDVKGLRIYTNVPGFPWELVRPQDADGKALDALGTRFQLGRWHLQMGMSGLTVPPTAIDFRELVGMMPNYEGDDALPAVQRELAALNKVPSFRRIPGVAASVAAVFKDPPNGVLHFAGHGTAQGPDDTSRRYALRLEDGAFDSTAFVGIDGKKLRDRETLVFFNACELGQADTTASIVEGWAPVMLDAGASGYIGALWPVGDDEAAAFAEAFYDDVERSIAAYGAAHVTEILRCLRAQGATRNDPTWQAYVFYGDPDTVLLREGVEPTDPGGRYTCEGS